MRFDSKPEVLLHRRYVQLKHDASNAAMNDFYSAAKYEIEYEQDSNGRSHRKRYTKEMIKKTEFGVPKSSIAKSEAAVYKASRALRTTNPEIFKIAQCNGGGIIPFKHSLPIILSLLLVENDGSRGWTKVHAKESVIDPIECGMLLFWDQSDGDYAQGEGNHFTDLFLKFTNFYEDDICMSVCLFVCLFVCVFVLYLVWIAFLGCLKTELCSH